MTSSNFLPFALLGATTGSMALTALSNAFLSSRLRKKPLKLPARVLARIGMSLAGFAVGLAAGALLGILVAFLGQAALAGLAALFRAFGGR
jgi:hypothetical protein